LINLLSHTCLLRAFFELPAFIKLPSGAATEQATTAPRAVQRLLQYSNEFRLGGKPKIER